MLKTIFSSEFYFARHGETEYNLKGIVSGDRDVPLSTVGISRSQSVAGIIGRLGVASAFCSPLSRARDTALYLLQETAITPIVLEGLKERHWGKLQGVSKTLLNNFNFKENNVEEWEEFYSRTVNALNGVNSPAPALVVAHSGTFRVLLEYLKIDIERKQVKNSYPYRFYKSGKSWRVAEV
ncbi:MAG: histidine phosphatase family protein [Deferribacteraceae bacterium]|jgi:broad specificity phosphatase PhoE|nr:histidine phosphatase family protein [Deferribacteraceae bacterium]